MAPTKHALPVPDEDTRACRPVARADGPRVLGEAQERGGEGDARQKLWDELSAFMPPKEEAKAGDDQAADDQAADAVAKAAIGD